MIFNQGAKTAVIVLCACTCIAAQTVKRNRDEGTTSVRASNVLGNGNIAAFLSGSGAYSRDGFALAPIIGASVGITEIMELYGQLVPVTSKGIGPIEAHLQITTPANDKLRFLGMAISADLYLSTAQDTISGNTSKDKPEYNSYPFATILFDVDWLAYKKWLPLKTYLKVSLVDNPDVLYRYDQIALVSSIEWKNIQNSLFASAGMGLYKEKQTKTRAGDDTYGQKYVWVEPGIRYRLFSQLSVLASTKVTVYQDISGKDPLKPELFNLSLKLEAPLFFTETNTEAIRTLIFMEQKKEKKIETAAKTIKYTNENSRIDGIELPKLDGDSLESFDFNQERQDLIKRREETQKKMADIERLFVDIAREDSLKEINNAGKAIAAPPMKQPDDK